MTSVAAFLPWLGPMPVWCKLYFLFVCVLAVWVFWRIFGPGGSAW